MTSFAWIFLPELIAIAKVRQVQEIKEEPMN
jgi:hypothetical protein